MYTLSFPVAWYLTRRIEEKGLPFLYKQHLDACFYLLQHQYNVPLPHQFYENGMTMYAYNDLGSDYEGEDFDIFRDISFNLWFYFPGGDQGTQIVPNDSERQVSKLQKITDMQARTYFPAINLVCDFIEELGLKYLSKFVWCLHKVLEGESIEEVRTWVFDRGTDGWDWNEVDRMFKILREWVEVRKNVV